MSKRFSDEEIRESYKNLTREQSPLSAIAGALIGAMPASVLFYVFASWGGTLIWFLFIPSAIIGYTSGYVGKVYEFKYRVIPGLIAVIIHTAGVLLVFQIHPLYLVTVPLSFGVSVYFSRRQLDNLQEAALWAKKYGKIKP